MKRLINVILLTVLASASCGDKGDAVLHRTADSGFDGDLEDASDSSANADGFGSYDIAEPPDIRPELTDLLDGAGEPDEVSDSHEADIYDLVDLVDLAQDTIDAIEIELAEEDIIDPATLIVPCVTQDDCNLTGLCLQDGTGESWCFPWCETEADCPPLYECAIPIGQEDPACLPLQAPTQCKPCASVEDCLSPDFDFDVTCASLGDSGSFCARTCTLDETLPCPFGFLCDPIQDGDQEVLRCLPKPGKKCFCSSYMEGLATACYYTNVWGTCEGARTCTNKSLSGCTAEIPVPEQCNGVDDNCDGNIDEDLDKTTLTCVIDYDQGACEFALFCANGVWNCPDVPFEGICAANQMSCIWWGSIIDTDEDYNPNFCDDDDDNDGFADVDDCQPTDPESYPGAMEFCDGIDNDCNDLSDYDQLSLSSCTSEGAWGTCAGKGFCVDGEWVCLPGPPAPENCPAPEDDCSYFPLDPVLDFDLDKIPDFCDSDDDGDGANDEDDNCLLLSNPNQLDLDEDGIGDPCDPDDDGDGSFDELDCCPYLYNPNQGDNDDDGTCDACDPDDDNDEVLDEDDNCQFVANLLQLDNESDGKGDACDHDDDNDEVTDLNDNCPLVPNLFQEDNELDGLGDICDPDDDNDELPDVTDNCPYVANQVQGDMDDDGDGDLCDGDVDGDGIDNDDDNCLLAANGDQQNTDGDTLGDACDPDMDDDGDNNSLDNCPLVQNPLQEDLDKDCPPTPYPGGVSCGDACDGDLDGDGTPNEDDNCPAVPNEDQADLDQDGVGDACSTDVDGDGVENDLDNCPKNANQDQLNSDDDELGDACDGDDDNDLVFDNDDNCPKTANAEQTDTDEDGIGDACDPDDD